MPTLEALSYVEIRRNPDPAGQNPQKVRGDFLTDLYLYLSLPFRYHQLEGINKLPRS